VANLKLPPDEQTGLLKLHALSDQAASNLLSAISSAAIKAEIDGLTIADLPEIPELSRTDAEQILETIVSLSHLRAYAEMGLDEFITDICQTMQSAGRKDLSLQKDALPQFRARLAKFLGLEDINRAAKSSVLRYEQERTVHGLRILTDARPIFGNDAAAAPEAAVILYTLKIRYYQAGHMAEMFFSFDEGDLEQLKEAIQRAELKATSLRSVLVRAKVKVFNLE
jgi:hypothetical protein